MKMDKDTLVKHRFWISVPVAVLFILIALICVLGVRSTTMANWGEAKRTDDALNALAARQDLRNEKWIQEMKVKMDAAVRQKDDLWYELYDKQNGIERMPVPPSPPGAESIGAPSLGGAAPAAPLRGKLLAIKDPLITWPARLHNEVPNWPPDRDRVPLVLRDFGEPLNPGNNMPNEYKSAFMAQYDELLKLVDFLDETAKPESGRVGSVRVVGTGKTTKDNARALLNPPIWNEKFVYDREAWLAQEDIAIKRGLLQAISDANDAVAKMEPEWRGVPLPEKPQPANPSSDSPGASETTAAPGGDPTPAAQLGDGTSPTEPKPQQPSQPLDRKRFLNSTWQVGVIPFDEATGKGPKTRWWDGWVLELELLPKGDDVLLRALSANMSTEHKLPADVLGGKLLVTVSNNDPQRPDERDFELDFSGQDPTRTDVAGKLIAEVSQGPLLDVKPEAGLSIRTLERPLGFKAKRIVRVQRAWDKATALDHQRFVNPTWLLDIRLVPRQGGAGPGVIGTIFNKGGKRTMPASFDVAYTTDGKDEYRVDPPIRPGGDAVNAGMSRDFDRQEIRNPVAPRRLTGARQILTWQTVPVKQINRLAIGYEAHLHSDRTKVTPLSQYDFKKKNPRPPVEAPVPGTGDGGAGPGAGGAGGAGGPAAGMASMGGAGAGIGGAGGSIGPLSPNQKLPLRRYYEVTDELRRIPVAVVLVVDEHRINDVLAAFANSRIRFRTTMSPWNRVPSLQRPDFLRPQASTGAGPSGNRPNPPGPMGPMPGAGQGTSPPPRGGTTGGGLGLPPGFGTGGGGSAGLPGPLGGLGGGQAYGPLPGDEEIPQVELQIYGLVTIYESPDAIQRIAEEKKNAAAAPQPGA